MQVCTLRKIWEPSALQAAKTYFSWFSRTEGIHQGPQGVARAQHSKVHHVLTFNIISLGLCRCIEKQSDGITKTKFVKLWHRLAYLERRPLKISLLMQIGGGEISTIMF